MVIASPAEAVSSVYYRSGQYFTSVQTIFLDIIKFKRISSDSTLIRLRSIRNFINTIHNRNEITDEEKQMRPKSATHGRANGLPKTHKSFVTVPKFRPISRHCQHSTLRFWEIPSTTDNDYNISDSFDAVDQIREVPSELFEQEHKWVSFNVESLFTNVLLNKTIKVILSRAYEEKLVETTLRKRTLKKLLKDCCQKTTFSFNSILYEQVDGVAMDSPLGPVLANIIMTELEKNLVTPLFQKNYITFYGRYADDTLVLTKPEHIDTILSKLNSFPQTFDSQWTHLKITMCISLTLQ